MTHFLSFYGLIFDQSVISKIVPTVGTCRINLSKKPIQKNDKNVSLYSANFHKLYYSYIFIKNVPQLLKLPLQSKFEMTDISIFSLNVIPDFLLLPSKYL